MENKDGSSVHGHEHARENTLKSLPSAEPRGGGGQSIPLDGSQLSAPRWKRAFYSGKSPRTTDGAQPAVRRLGRTGPSPRCTSPCGIPTVPAAALRARAAPLAAPQYPSEPASRIPALAEVACPTALAKKRCQRLEVIHGLTKVGLDDLKGLFIGS